MTEPLRDVAVGGASRSRKQGWQGNPLLGVRGRRAFALALLVAGLVVAPTGHAIATAPSGSGARSEGTLEDGKLLYRKYCGQCHALKVARAVGFGTVSHPFGKEGGPSFNNLRVPYSLSVLLLTQKSNGHEVLFHKLTWKQVRQVATWLERATKDNAVLARPTDG